MNKLTAILVAVAKDTSGDEVLEYALIVGLVIVAAITSVGKKVLAKWTSLNASM